MDNNVYFGEWTCKDDIIGSFDINKEIKKEISDLDIICAVYGLENCSGDCFVLFRKDGKLYEINDNHCSCYGLQNWEPEETTKQALLKRNGCYDVWEYFGKELKEIINKLE